MWLRRDLAALAEYAALLNSSATAFLCAPALHCSGFADLSLYLDDANQSIQMNLDRSNALAYFPDR